MAFIPRPHEIYKHFKGNLYQITAVAEHTETGEQLVVYQALYGDFKTYARPLQMFISKVDREKYPDAAQEYRFELQGENRERQQERERMSAEGKPQASGKPEMNGKNQADGQCDPDGKSHAGEGTECAQTAETAVSEIASDETVMVSEAEPVSEDEQVLDLDPMVLEFLDADTYEQRLNILAGLHHRITDDMITTMAVACDVEVPEGETEVRYASLKNCLLTLEKYECNRLR